MGGGGGAPMPCVMKLLAPEAMASAVIGRGGKVIAEMRESTGAKIGLTEHSELFPGTECRVLTAGTSDEDSMSDLCARIIAQVAECAKDAPSEDMGQDGEIKLRALMPKAAVGGIIGK